MRNVDADTQDSESQPESYTDKLESIMDNYYSQRAERVADIRVNYEQQIRELEKESDESEVY